MDMNGHARIHRNRCPESRVSSFPGTPLHRLFQPVGSRCHGAVTQNGPVHYSKSASLDAVHIVCLVLPNISLILHVHVLASKMPYLGRVLRLGVCRQTAGCFRQYA